jgi:hypothetical protein
LRRLAGTTIDNQRFDEQQAEQDQSFHTLLIADILRNIEHGFSTAPSLFRVIVK